MRFHRTFLIFLLGLTAVTVVSVASSGESTRSDPVTRADASARPVPSSPRPPRSYRRPGRATRVHTSEQLVRALRRGAVTTIVLAPGAYATAGTSSDTPYFHAQIGHRLYASRPGTAVLRSGLVFGGNDGPGGGEAHGLTFDIRDGAATGESAAIHTWGPAGVNTKVLDTTLRGHGVLESGIRADEVQGLVVRRVLVRGFRRYGLFASDNDPSSRASARLITDVNVRSVKEAVPGSEEGRAEYGVWVGNSVRRPVARIKIRDFGWAGLWTGNNANDVRFTDLDIDGSARPDGNAIYIEHKTRRNVFERFRLGPDIKEGFVSEWNGGSGSGGGIDNLVQDGVIDTNTRSSGERVGVFADLGTIGMRVRRVTFLHADYACIVDLGTGTVIGKNNYRGRLPGAAAVSRDHP